MTPTAWCLLSLAVVVAVLGWFAVARGHRRRELAARVAVTVTLVAATWALDPAHEAERALFSVALALSIGRDLAAHGAARWFPVAVASSMLSHAVYVAAFQQAGFSWLWAAAGIVVVLVAAARYGVRLVLGVRAAEPALTVPVTAYVGVLSVMVVAAAATGRPAAVAGAFLFYVSDALTGWNRYIAPTPFARESAAGAYDLARVLLVLSLV